MARYEFKGLSGTQILETPESGSQPQPKPQPVSLPQVRCPKCQKRLFDGVMIGTIQCKRCKLVVTFIARENIEAYSSIEQALRS